MAYQLGVDLGTTYTAAAVIRDGRAEVATLGTRTLEIPSVVLLREDGELLIGEAAERRSQTEPDRFAREFKRRMGDPTPILLGGSPFSAHALTAHLLRNVVKVVADREGGPPDHIVVTCPANWGEYKRELLVQAVHQADVGDVSIATEPEAAAVHYASTTRVGPGEIVAVYDLGGGTFDAAVLRNAGDRFDLLGDPRGIEQLGGVYFDEAVFAWVVDRLGESFHQLEPDDAGAMAALTRLRRDCVEAKESLSWDTDTAIPVALPNHRTEIRLTRSEFEDMIRPALADTVDALQRSLASADVRPEQLTSVLLVGGSSRIPLVGQMLVAGIGRPVAIDVHPKHAVALGAAHMAAAQAGAAAEARAAAAGVEVEPATVLEPPLVSRAGRTTVASPAGTRDVPIVPATGRAAVSPVGPGAAPDGAGGSSVHGSRSGPGGAGGPGAHVEAEPTAAPGGERGPSGPGAPGGPPSSARTERRLNPLVLAGAAVGAVVVAAAAFMVLGGGDDGSPGEAEADPTDGAPGDTASPPPPDLPRGEPLGEGTIAYTQVDTGFWNVWLVEADGTNARPLTRETEDKARLPVLSPDRRSVAYSVQTAGGWELRVIDSGGQGDRVLSSDIVTDARATWSPDGTRLAFVSDKDGPADLVVLDLATGGLTKLTDTPEDEGDPAWSPDGTSIAYWSLAAGNMDIFTVPADGGAASQITSAPGDEADPAWSPDGTSIAYASNADGDWDIYVMGRDGSSPRLLTEDPADDQDPAWSPDGTQLVFESKRDSAERVEGDWAELYAMAAADGSDERRLTQRDGLDAHPAWATPPPA